MTIGKLEKSFKRVPTTDTLQPMAVTNISFCHEFANAGETTIDFSNLVPSDDWTNSGKQNPSASAILGANLRFFKNQVILTSSSKGFIQSSQYEVTSSYITFKTFASEAGESFEVQVMGLTSLGHYITDSKMLKVQGVLPANTTDFNIGTGLKIFPEQIMVFVESDLKTRNQDNSAALTATGDYYMVDNTSTGVSSVIRFNTSTAGNRKVVVVSIGGFSEKPTISMMSEVESLSGKINSIIDYLTVQDSIPDPEITFPGYPHYQDLNQFGNNVYKLERNVQVAANDIDFNLGSLYWKNVAANTAFTFSNVYNGKDFTFIVRNTSASPVTLTFPVGSYMPTGTVLSVAAGMENEYSIKSSNGKVYISSVAGYAIT